LFKDYCAELKLSVFSISHGGSSHIDNHLEAKKVNLLLSQQCRHLVWHTSSKLLILMSLYS